jgi:hypothetical protein
MELLTVTKVPKMVKVPLMSAKEVSAAPLDRTQRTKDIPDSMRDHLTRILSTSLKMTSQVLKV